MSNKSKKRDGIIYSTNPNFKYNQKQDIDITLPPNQQKLEIWKQKRNGKIVILIKGFVGSDKNLKELGKLLRIKCAVGGSVKNQDIIIQGDIREKIEAILSDLNYTYKKVGG